MTAVENCEYAYAFFKNGLNEENEFCNVDTLLSLFDSLQ